MTKATKTNKLVLFFYALVSFLLSHAASMMLISRIKTDFIPPLNLFTATYEFSGILVCSVYLSSCALTRNHEPKRNRLFADYLFSVVLAIFSDFTGYIADGASFSGAALICHIANALYYLLNAVLIYAILRYFLQILPPATKSAQKYTKNFVTVMRVYIAVLALALAVNYRYGFIFSIVDGSYVRGSFYWIPFGAIGLFLAGLLPTLFEPNLDVYERYSLGIFITLPVICKLLELAFPRVSFTQLGIVLATSILFVHGHVREHHRQQEQQITITRQQAAIMLSQIQPHFLFNSLSSIAMLCDTDPKRAKAITLTFTKYLRGNMNSLSSKTPILFSDERAHTEAYLQIESLRFPDLKVVFDTPSMDFLIPPLSLQPLVENAVKHGVCQREEGGTVRIATSETETDFTLTVSDDGVGFDPASVDWNDTSHIGIVNVRNRLHTMVGGTLTVQSTPGKGTVATITVPKNFSMQTP